MKFTRTVFLRMLEIIREMNEVLACPIHKEMKISYRCNDHSTCICTVCRVDTHRNCEHVFNITEGGTSDRDLQCVQERLENLRTSTASLKDRREKNRKALYQTGADIFHRQKVIIEKAIGALEELKVEFEQEVDEQVKDTISCIDCDIEFIELSESKVKRYERLYEATKKYGDTTSSRIIEHFLFDSMTKQNDIIEFVNKNEEYRLSFEENEGCIQVSRFGEFSLIQVAGSKTRQKNTDLEKTSDEVTDKEMCTFNPVNTSASTSTQSLPTTSTDKQREIDISVGKDKNMSSIYGITVLSDGGLVLIDNANFSIKLFSSDYKLLHVLRLPERPIRICSIGNHEVAVSFHRLKRINRYRVVGNTIVYDGGFRIDLFNHGIGFDGKHILALMCDEVFGSGNNAKHDMIVVDVLDPFDGLINERIFDFKVMGNRPWSLALNNIQALQFTLDRSIVIAERNRIISFSLWPTSLFINIAAETDFYVGKGEDIKDKIENIAIGSDNIYVCTASGHVLQLCASDFSENRVIVSDPERSFCSIAVDEINGRLILGCKEKDEILVYDI